MKKALAILTAVSAALALTLGAAGCGEVQSVATTETSAVQTTAANAGDSAVASTADSSSTTAGNATAREGQAVTALTDALTAIYDDEDLDDSWSNSSASFVTLADGSIRFDGAGATAGGDEVKITQAGTYVVSGTATDARIVVDLQEKGVVRLVLNGASITCSDSAPIYIKNASKTVITLVAGTQNSVTDGQSHVLDDTDSGEPDAVIFSKDDLTVNGTGSLTVTANYKHGIAGNDDLKLVSGDIIVNAVSDAIRGKDCVGVKDAAVTVRAGSDGLQATNDAEPGKGFVDIQGGTLNIIAGGDAIQAETTLLVAGGDVTLVTGGGSEKTDTTDSASAKGLKAAGGVFVTGGTLDMDTADDSVNSNGTIQIDGGDLTVAAGDDAMHADATLQIDGGQVDITKSYEGLESAVITINDGTIHVESSDDGLNIAGGNDTSSANGPRGQDMFTVNENNQLYVNGGYLYVDAKGDGIDCNGRVFMTGGTLIINGPVSDGNGAMDYMGECTISGGFLVAVGSSGMAEAPTQSSTLHSIMVGFDSAQPAGTLVCIADQDGNSLVTMAPTKEFESVLLCSPDIQDGATYSVYLGGTSTGTVTDSVYSDGTYEAGTSYATLTVSGIVTTYGSFGSMEAMIGGSAPQGARPARGAKPGDAFTSTTLPSD